MVERSQTVSKIDDRSQIDKQTVKEVLAKAEILLTKAKMKSKSQQMQRK